MKIFFEILKGEITLTLPVGPHTARLQWRTFGDSVREWSTFQNMLDGFGSSRTLLAMVHAHNSRPVVHAPLLPYNMDEDNIIHLTQINVNSKRRLVFDLSVLIQPSP